MRHINSDSLSLWRSWFYLDSVHVNETKEKIWIDIRIKAGFRNVNWYGESGKFQDRQTVEPHFQAIADYITCNYDILKKHYSILQDLEETYRLLVILELLKRRGIYLEDNEYVHIPTYEFPKVVKGMSLAMYRAKEINSPEYDKYQNIAILSGGIDVYLDNIKSFNDSIYDKPNANLSPAISFPLQINAPVNLGLFSLLQKKSYKQAENVSKATWQADNENLYALKVLVYSLLLQKKFLSAIKYANIGLRASEASSKYPICQNRIVKDDLKKYLAVGMLYVKLIVIIAIALLIIISFLFLLTRNLFFLKANIYCINYKKAIRISSKVLGKSIICPKCGNAHQAVLPYKLPRGKLFDDTLLSFNSQEHGKPSTVFDIAICNALQAPSIFGYGLGGILFLLSLFILIFPSNSFHQYQYGIQFGVSALILTIWSLPLKRKQRRKWWHIICAIFGSWFIGGGLSLLVFPSIDTSQRFSIIFFGLLLGIFLMYLSLICYIHIGRKQVINMKNDEVVADIQKESEFAKRLAKLNELKSNGFITEEEFNIARKKIYL